jgi:hypothetical protein
MHGEWEWSDEILFWEITEPGTIICIIDFYNEFLVFFKGESDFNSCDPLWIEIIIDNLCISNHFLLSIFDLE